MKRKLAAFFVTGCIIAGALTGCGKTAEPKADATQNTDLSAQVTDQNSIDDTEKAFKAFEDALKAAEDADSATLDSELIFTMSFNGETRAMTQHSNIKRSKADDKERLEYSISAKSKAEGGEEDGEENISEISGYYADGTFYQDMPGKESGDDEKKSEPIRLKVEEKYDDVVAYISSAVSYTAPAVEAEYVASAAMEEKDGGTQYIFILDNDKMSEYMSAFAAYSMGITLSEDESIAVNYANISAALDPDGKLTDYTFSLDTIIKSSEGDISFTYNIATKFSGINSTTVKDRSEDELSKYMTEDEYMASQQTEAQTGEAPSGQKLSPEEMEEMGLDPELYDAEIITEAPQQ